MADLDDGSAKAAVVEEFFLDPDHDRVGKHGGTGAEIVDATVAEHLVNVTKSLVGCGPAELRHRGLG
jgi:hypothetical protein